MFIILDLPEDDVLPVEPLRRDRGHEELRPLRGTGARGLILINNNVVIIINTDRITKNSNTNDNCNTNVVPTTDYRTCRRRARAAFASRPKRAAAKRSGADARPRDREGKPWREGGDGGGRVQKLHNKLEHTCVELSL